MRGAFTIEQRPRARLTEIETISDAAEDECSVKTLDQQAVGRLNRIDALQRQQMALEAERRRQLERRRILAALDRIAEDEYGWCAECGEAIATARLEVDPTAISPEAAVAVYGQDRATLPPSPLASAREEAS